MMLQSFEFTKSIQNLLFYGWTSNSAGGLVGSCVVMAAFGIILEGTKMLSLQLSEAMPQPLILPPRGPEQPEDEAPGSSHQTPSHGPHSDNRLKKRVGIHCVQTLVHLLRFIMGYFLMLAVMTYNAWFLIATVLGSGIGYLLFGSSRGAVEAAASRDGDSPSRGSDQTTSTVTYPRDYTEQSLIDD